MNDVPLRDFVERLIADNNRHRDDLRIEDNRRLDDSIKAVARALDLQAGEYERRLDVLNHAHEEAQRILSTYIRITVFEEFLKGYQEWKGKLDIEHAGVLDRLKAIEIRLVALIDRVQKLEGDQFERGGRSKSYVTILAIITVVGTIISIFTAVSNFAQ